MKTRIKLIIFITLVLNFSVSAQQTVHSARSIVRGASTEIDAVYSNPAGTIKLSDGLHLLSRGVNHSINNQFTFQKKEIYTSYPAFVANGGRQNKIFKSKSDNYISPEIISAYKKGKFVFSGIIGIQKTNFKYNNGLPSFEVAMSKLPQLANELSVSTSSYSLRSSYQESENTIYGHLGISYMINSIFSVYGGIKLHHIKTNIKGDISGIQINPYCPEIGLDGAMIPAYDFFSLIGDMNLAEQVKETNIDVVQSGIGLSPIIGINANFDKLNIGVKYEFRNSIKLKNKTKRDDIGYYPDGMKTPDDIPALLSIGLSYQLIPQLITSIGYYHIFEGDAKKSNNRHEYIKGTNEFQAGLEYRLNDRLLFSIGGQVCLPSIENEYQTELDYLLKSYTIGGGIAYNLTHKIRINAGCRYTGYSDYAKESDNSRTDVFSKKKTVIAVGIDYRF